MYADDTVLFANSKENLQNCLNGLNQYCNKWKLQINAEKNKVLIFSNRKVNSENIDFTIAGKSIEIIDEFKYLGVTISHNGSFNANLADLEEKGNRALFSLIKKARRENLPLDIYLIGW